MDEGLYPCIECGMLRTEKQGGTTFTVCDKCWEKAYPGSIDADELVAKEGSDELGHGSRKKEPQG